MVNKDRIVPVQKTDLLSLYATMLQLMFSMGEHPIELTVLPSKTVDGQFAVTEAGLYIANQPVKAMSLPAEGGAQVFFVADYDFDGFYVNDTKVEVSADIKNDATTLYVAQSANGAVTVTAYTPSIDGASGGGDTPKGEGGNGPK